MAFVMIGRDAAVSFRWVGAHDGVARRRFNYYGHGSDKELGIEAHLAELTDATPIRPHAHSVDQFQVMFGVPGAMYQRTPVPPVMVHYVDAYSTYGPITADQETFHFLTLRPEDGADQFNMPADRDRMPYRGLRHFFEGPEKTWEESRLPEGETITEVLYGPDDDGLTLGMVTAGPSTPFTLPTLHRSRGQYVCVTDGSVEWEGSTFGVQSLGWQPDGEAPVDLRAGSEGTRVLLLRFPFPSSEETRHRNEEAGAVSSSAGSSEGADHVA